VRHRMPIARFQGQARRRKCASGLIAGALIIVGSVLGLPAHGAPKTDLHHAPNHNFDASNRYLPGQIGFNLADVDDVRQLRALPSGAKGLVWVGQCKGVDAGFLKTVGPFVGRPEVFGFYLMDDPDPTGRYNPLCTADNLKAESDWIHAHAGNAKTFVVLMKLASSKAPSFINTYNFNNSHIDLYGIDPYPCRTEISDCDYEMIDRYVAAADAWGIPRSALIPVYQAFGSGNWHDDGGGRYVFPSISQMEKMLERWETFAPAPVFDYAYSWGTQNGDQALESSPDLQALFARHNKALRP
jgi:hypothetical protein